MTGLASRALVPRTVRGLVDEGALAVTRHAPLLPVCGLGGHDDCARVRLVITRPSVTGRGHTCPATSHVTAHPFLLTVCGLGRGAGGLGRVTGIVRRLLLPPRITATLCRTLPGCSSACQGPWCCGMQPWDLCLWLLGCCLALPLR